MALRFLTVALVLLTLGGMVWVLLGDEASTTPATLAPRPAATSRPMEFAPATGRGEKRIGAAPTRLDAPAPAVDPVAVVDRPDSATGTVRGTVVDENGDPVRGEPVDLLIQGEPWFWRAPDADPDDDVVDRTTSDADGRFELKARPGATHELLAGGRAHARAALTDVVSGDDLVLEVGRALEVTGFVVDDSGTPVPGVTVGAFLAGGDVITTTDELGAFRLSPVPDMPLLLGAYAFGYDVATDDSVVPGWGDVTLELRPGRDVRGTVTERNTNDPVAGASVRLVVELDARETGADDPLEVGHVVAEHAVVTDTQGRFVVPGGPSWAFRLEVEADGYVPARHRRHEERALLPDEEVSVLLLRAEAIAGFVLRDDTVVSGATVYLEQDGRVAESTLTDDQGAFGLPIDTWDGSGQLAVHAVTADGWSGRLRVRKDDHGREVYVSLAPVVERAAQVVAGGEPLPGAHLTVYSDGAPPTLLVAGQEGRVAVQHAVVGPQVTSISMQARYGDIASLPVLVDLAEPADEPVVVDVDLGGWVAGHVQTTWGEPVAGARLVASAAIAHSDRSGRFRLGPLDDSETTTTKIGVSAEGHRSTQLEAFHGDDDLIVVLDPVVLWEGQVVDVASGLPLERFAGRLQKLVSGGRNARFEDTPASVEASRSQPGDFSVQLGGEGRYRVRLMAQDYMPSIGPELVFDGHTPPPPCSIVVSQAAVLELTLIDAGGRPVPGFELSVVPHEHADQGKPPKRSAPGTRNGRTSWDGRLRLNLSDGGGYAIASRGEWLEPGPVWVAPGPPVARSVRFGATGDLEIQVRDDDGEPVLNPKIDVRPAPGAKANAVKRKLRPAGAPRTVLVEVLPPAQYVVSAKSRDGTAEETVTVTPGRLSVVDLVLGARDGAKPKSAKKQAKTQAGKTKAAQGKPPR